MCVDCQTMFLTWSSSLHCSGSAGLFTSYPNGHGNFHFELSVDLKAWTKVKVFAILCHCGANLKYMLVCCLPTQNFQAGSVGRKKFFLLTVQEKDTISRQTYYI